MDQLAPVQQPMLELSEVAQDLTDRYMSSARDTLVKLIGDPKLIRPDRLARVPGSFTRNLLFGDERMGAWALVWSPRARTPIHDHHCSCSFAILSGAVREISFTAIDDSRAVKTGEVLHRAGYIASMIPTGPNIHQMVNDGTDEAISIHIYGYDHRRHRSSVHREYQQVET
jgi:predicted metal-dependent enzyme (double-stranded beta helix superfamily)